ncbi:MAG: polysaccharide pyruvyl transferase family protein [Thermomicrobiales bacterium]
MTNRPVVVVTNVFGPLNRGDFELFEQLVELLDDCNVHAIARDPAGAAVHFPGVSFHLQPGIVSERRGRLGQAMAVLRTSALMLSPFLAVMQKVLPKEQREALKVIDSADLVIACPGGYLTNATHSFYPQVAQVFAASRKAKRFWLAPMSIGPAHTFFEKALLRAALSNARAVYVRETWSQNFCTSLEIDSILSSDLAFLPTRRYADGLNEQTKDCITATVVRWNFPDSSNVDEAINNYHHAMAVALDRASQRHQLPVKLLLQVDNDREVSERVAGLMRAPTEIVRVETPEEYRQILSRAAVMFASRFHSAVFAMCVRTPTVVISYLPKGRYMMEDMGLAEFVVDIEDVSAERLETISLKIESADSGYRTQVRRALTSLISDEKNPFVEGLRVLLLEIRREG